MRGLEAGPRLIVCRCVGVVVVVGASGEKWRESGVEDRDVPTGSDLMLIRTREHCCICMRPSY